jgi:hypothetical protein
MKKNPKHSNFPFLEKKLHCVCFLTEISALDLKKPSFLKKKDKNGGKQTNSKKRGGKIVGH